MAFFSTGEDREKLSILFVLKLAGIPLSREQIATVMFEQGFENYIELSERLIELESNACIATIPAYKLQTVVLTRRGEEIITLFEKNLPLSLRTSIEELVTERVEDFRRENTAQMESTFHSEGNFSTRLSLVENGEAFFEIKLKLPSARYTRIAEKRWIELNTKLYFDTLLALTSEDGADAHASPEEGGNTDRALSYDNNMN
ncbi:MAG: DUF4364 family protein [Clostridia bacterium]|nr:DUF4364 family protein [Clostridia bacterium]